MNHKYSAAYLSLASGLIHAAFIHEHFEEWWGYGLFFLAATVAQVAYAPLLFAPMTHASRRAFLSIGIIGNLAVVAMWLCTRTLGVPFFGPAAGEIESVTFWSALSVLIELVLVIQLGRIAKNAEQRLLPTT